jgi:hypothetical protein
MSVNDPSFHLYWQKHFFGREQCWEKGFASAMIESWA